MALIVQQPYNLFAQQKRAGYPSAVQAPVESQPVEAVAKPQPAVAPMVQQKPAANAAGTVALQPGSSTAGMDYLNSLYTSPQEEEKLRKASVMNQRILAIGDAIRHIGNIANTVNYAPAQQLNSPVAEEQARYERGKALRDKANQQYYAYQQQKAAQDEARRRWEQQMAYNQAKDAANLEATRAYREATLAEQQRYHDMVNSLNVRKADDTKANNEKRTNIMQQNANANSVRASRYGTGGTRTGVVGGYTTTKKKMVKNPLTGKYEEVTETTTRVPNSPKKALPGQESTGKKKLPQ